MTAVTEEKYDAGTSPDDFAVAEDPPETEPAGEQGEAPYGWTRDRVTGELRPRKRPGRPSVPPPPEQVTAAEPVERAADRPPGTPGKGKGGGKGKTDSDVPMPRGGVIAAGVNKLYRRGGKFLRVLDHDLGQAMIECTRRDPEDEDDELTVGEAWENLCKTNPRVRRFVMKAIAGGAVGDLVMAHAPMGIALLMKPMIQRLIPFERLLNSLAEPDEDTPDGEGGLPGGMTATDFEQMKAMAADQARRMAAKMGVTLSDEEMAEATAQAMASDAVPTAFRRQQPRRMTKAQRRGAPG